MVCSIKTFRIPNTIYHTSFLLKLTHSSAVALLSCGKTCRVSKQIKRNLLASANGPSRSVKRAAAQCAFRQTILSWMNDFICALARMNGGEWACRALVWTTRTKLILYVHARGRLSHRTSKFDFRILIAHADQTLHSGRALCFDKWWLRSA